MVIWARVKIYSVNSRHSINLSSEFVRDSAFPFGIGEELIAKIAGKKIIIEKSHHRHASGERGNKRK